MSVSLVWYLRNPAFFLGSFFPEKVCCLPLESLLRKDSLIFISSRRSFLRARCLATPSGTHSGARSAPRYLGARALCFSIKKILNAHELFMKNTALKRSLSPASYRSCARSLQYLQVSAKCSTKHSSPTTSSAPHSGGLV